MSLLNIERYPVFLCSAISVVVALAVLAGWVTDISVLKSISPGLPAMKPNTALAFVFAGVGLLFAARVRPNKRISYAALVCGIAIFLIGLLTVLEYAWGWDLPIDTFLIQLPSLSEAGVRIGRMSPHSAFNFTLVGISLISISAGFNKLSGALTSVVFVVTILAMLGLLYGAERLYGISQYNSMAVHTGLLFLVITAGLGLVDDRSRLSRIIKSKGAGGSMGRRIIPLVLIVPPVIGLILHAGFRAGFYDASFRLALTVGCSMIVMSIVLYKFCLSLDAIDFKRGQAETELADKEARYRELFDYSQGLICIHDLDGVLTTVNRATLRMLEYTEEEIVGRNLRHLVRPEFFPMFDAYLRQVTHEGLASGLLELISKSGNRVVLRYNNVLATEDGKAPYILGHAQNVTELLDAQKQLKTLSLTDDLTGLYNRRGFAALAEQQLKLEMHTGTARGLTLLFADMDGLKAINDNYGHENGSEAIKALGRLIKSAVREADVVARWGGDEFVILTIGAKGESPHMMVERINVLLTEYNANSGLPYGIACSIGVAPIDPDGDETFEEMIAAADEAMYVEKKRRKSDRNNINTLARPKPSLNSETTRST
ncbi:MAG: diguanylate cyclase [Acidobacteria bacterium]|nr:diguanylate cyclase [Acidobacteriota bacterium]